MRLRSFTHKACYQIHRSGHQNKWKQVVRILQETFLRERLPKKSNSHSTLLILCRYYLGLNIPAASCPAPPACSMFLPSLLTSGEIRKVQVLLTLEGTQTVIKLIFFTTLLKGLRFGVCPGGLGFSYPNPSTHPRDHTWHCKPEHFCSLRKCLLELPTWPVPFVLPKERTTPLPTLLIHGPSAYRSIVASWPFPATQGSPTALLSTPATQELPFAPPQVDSLHLQQGAMPCSLQDSYIQKKTAHVSLDTSVLLLIESFPNPTESILLSFMSKGTVPILRYPTLLKDIFQRT